ncbi:MAG TPA: hypothetical protein VHX88_21075 [Solirubrobacteraceae bacterium]|jgi:uncharacterized repeat protein (TIGR01451 family)|nr:hypothetical protein [Solirubrobacteraceae bacterium]
MRAAVRILLASTVVVLALAAVGRSTPPASAAGVSVPFTCSTPEVFLAQTPAGGDTQLEDLSYTPPAATFTTIGPPWSGGAYNGIAMDPTNDFMYAISSVAPSTGDLLRIDANGVVTDLGATSPSVGGANVGAFDASGNLYEMVGTSTDLYRVNVATAATTHITLSAAPDTADFTLVGSDFWGQVSGTDELVRVDPATGAVGTFTAPIPSTVGAGAAWTFGNGDLGLSDNTTGDIYQLNIANPDSDAPTITLVSEASGPGSSGNDGTSCEGAPVDLGITKSAPAGVAEGGTVTWTLDVHNYGPGTSSGYVVNDTVPAPVTGVASTTPGCTVTGNAVQCIEGTLAPDADATITITGTAPASAQNIQNTATVIGNESDPNSANNTATSTTTTPAPVPFACDTPSVILGQGTASTQLENVIYSPGMTSFSAIGTPVTPPYNAIGLNPLDDFVYGLQGGTAGLLRIDSAGNAIPLGTTTPPLPAETMNVGAVDGAGDYYVMAGTSSTMYKVDLATMAMTPITLSAAPNISDFSFVDGDLWGSVNFTDELARIDPATGVVTVFPTTFLPSTIAAGAAWTFGNGDLGLDDNNTGNVWQIAIANPDSASPTFTLVSTATGQTLGNDDGTSCAGLPVDLAITKTGPASVSPSGAITWTLGVHNYGPGQSSGYTVTDAVPASVTGVASSSPGCTVTGNSVVCVEGPLGDGDDAPPITITGTAPATHASSIQNTATVTGNEMDPTPGNDTATSTTTTPPAADVSIVKTASPSPAVPGQSATYTLTVSNAGPDAASGVSVTDALPAGLTSISASAGCSDAGGTVTCTDASLASGASTIFTITAAIASSVTGGIANTATVTSTTPDPNPGNNTSTITTPTAPSADLSLTKTASPSPAIAGQEVTYTLTVTNNGPSDAGGVSVSDPLPSTETFVSASTGCTDAGSTVTCTQASLAAGASVAFQIVAHVASSAAGHVANTATVTSNTPDPDPGNNTATSTVGLGTGVAALTITKTASVTSTEPGGQVLYTLVVQNHGPSDATGATVTDTAPAGETIIAAQPSQGTCTTQPTLTCSLGTIANGGTVQILVTASVSAGASGTLVNQASVTSNQVNPDPGGATATSTVPVTPGLMPPSPAQQADLQITKVASASTARLGQTLDYTIKVTNVGPAEATGVHVLDTPSLPVQILAVHPSTGVCSRSVPIACSLGALASGRTVTITVRMRALATGTLDNAASVTGNQVDPATANNLATVRIPVVGALELRKTATRSTLVAGERTTFHITVTNPASAPVTDVKVCDNMPPRLAYVSSRPRAHSSSGRFCWTIASLGAHASRTLAIVARALNGHSGAVVNTASATAPGIKTARASHTVHLISHPVAGGVTG